MLERQIFQNKDLILKVSKNYNPEKFNPDKYETFIEALCENREYQKEAIRETIRYLLGGEYDCLKDLAEENYKSNSKLQEKYASFDEFVKNLQLPHQLSCSLDHATGTGKSYVMYGIARIMLAEGAVNRVLVLCPSNTIENGLTEKFKSLSSNRVLKDLLPENSETLNPSIINASATIRSGDICIENIHATFMMSKSAIQDSLTGRGESTLVLNDEAHHMKSPFDKSLKKWKEFLIDNKYGFRYIVNVSGTCYVGNDYFADVIHRFSLRDAIEAKFVKLIRYVAEDSSVNEQEKFQKIYDNHLENKRVKYYRLKPLTILVTKDITACKRLTNRLIDFLASKEGVGKEEVAKKVLIVNSHRDHKKNIPVLMRVDDRENSIEWITSVSMLTEGWDVKNVFQIVPSEERAFNSKLLIAQVLGRGLRIPEECKGNQPVVTVFNHDRWSVRIKHLVNEVLEIEKRINSYSVDKKEDYNFELHHIEYKRCDNKKETPQEEPYELLKKGYIAYKAQERKMKKTTKYIKAVSGKTEEKETEIEYRMYPVDRVVNEVVNKLMSIDMDLDSNYSAEFDKNKVKEIILNSLQKIGEKNEVVDEYNYQNTLKAFGVVYRKKTESIRLNIEAKKIFRINTQELNKSSLGIGSLRRDGTVFCDECSFKLGKEEDIKSLREIKADESLLRSSFCEIENKYDFKTPLNVVLTSHKPERLFVKKLTKTNIASKIDAWIKSVGTGFYSIDYSWRKGEHPKQGSFNPDFFIKTGNDILVVEIKSDNDVSEENKAKLRFAGKHFYLVNKKQKEQNYFFKMLSPKDYDLFFKAFQENRYKLFKSELETKLEK